MRIPQQEAIFGAGNVALGIVLGSSIAALGGQSAGCEFLFGLGGLFGILLVVLFEAARAAGRWFGGESA